MIVQQGSCALALPAERPILGDNTIKVQFQRWNLFNVQGGKRNNVPYYDTTLVVKVVIGPIWTSFPEVFPSYA